MEYLYSQTGAVLERQDLDPDTPDGTVEAEEDWEDGDEGFEEEEEELEEIRLISHHHALLLQPVEPRGAPATAAVAEASTSQSGPTHAPPAEAEDDVSRGMPVFISPVRVTVWCGFMSRLCAFLQDVVGPDGHGGYQLVVPLAHALVDLRDRAFVPHRQARDIIALWQKLSDRDKAAVTFPPPPPGPARPRPLQDEPPARSHTRSGQCEAVSITFPCFFWVLALSPDPP